jgi:sensor histidine kinase YesM
MKKSVFYLLHAIVILAALFIGFLEVKGLMTYYETPLLVTITDVLLCNGSILGLIYLAYWLFLPQYLVKKEYLKFAGYLVALIAGYTIFFEGTTLFVQHVLHVKYHVFVKGWWTGIVFYACFYTFIGTLFRLLIQWFEDVQVKEELEKQNFKSELSLLKNQLNPHFLFNTLNNIDSLIHENPANASLSLNKLSEIMRYMVYDTEKEWVNLQDEVDYIQNYISLQKLRIPNADIIQMTVSGSLKEYKVPPMLFIPFVENAFKHSSLKEKAGNNITISIDIANNQLRFYCSNAIAVINKDKSSGVGLDLIQKRLALIYRKNYNLSIQNTGDVFTVNLTINLA